MLRMSDRYFSLFGRKATFWLIKRDEKSISTEINNLIVQKSKKKLKSMFLKNFDTSWCVLCQYQNFKKKKEINFDQLKGIIIERPSQFQNIGFEIILAYERKYKREGQYWWRPIL